MRRCRQQPLNSSNLPRGFEVALKIFFGIATLVLTLQKTRAHHDSGGPYCMKLHCGSALKHKFQLISNHASTAVVTDRVGIEKSPGGRGGSV